MEILYHLSQIYSRYWYLQMTNVPAGMIEGKVIGRDEKKEDVTIMPLKDLPMSIRQTPFFPQDIGFGTIAFPKGTRVRYLRNENDHSCEFQFSKPLHFDMRIRVRYQSGFPGLMEVGNYVGLTSLEDRFLNPESQAVYTTVVLKMDCEARFTPLMEWNPDVVRYKAWIQSLFDGFYSAFDWGIVSSKMTNYYVNLAAEKIIRKESRVGLPPEESPIKAFTFSNKK